jgi:hypothetical protein
MYKRKAAALAIAGFCLGRISYAEPAADIQCKRVPGMIAEPIVPTADAAQKIYLAIVEARGDKLLASPRVKDDGDHWSVFQLPNQNPLVRGGGMLEITISKCDASVLAHYSR